jgi:hypothetical protein
MNYINVRQLLSNLEESTKELPVTVTRFGKPIFIISGVGAKIEPRIELVPKVAVEELPSDVKKVAFNALKKDFGTPCTYQGCTHTAVGKKNGFPFCKEHLG